MSTIDPPWRGRPPKPTDHPVGARMRELRRALGLTVRDVAVQAGLGESSASYISQLESGAKTPRPQLALRLAAVLRDEPRIYLAWAATGRRSDPVETARAVHLLGRLLGHARYTDATAETVTDRPRPGADAPIARKGRRSSRTGALDDAAIHASATDSRPEIGHEPPRSADVGEEHVVRADVIAGPASGYLASLVPQLPEIPVRRAPGDVPQAKVLVPEIEEGADPGDETGSAPRVLAMHRVAADSLAGIEPPVRPFAFRVSAATARRTSDVLAIGDLAIVSRQAWPLERHAPYAVRRSGHLVVGRVLWNGRELLLLPGADESDFAVMDAPDRTALDRMVAGKVVARIRDRH